MFMTPKIHEPEHFVIADEEGYPMHLTSCHLPVDLPPGVYDEDDEPGDWDLDEYDSEMVQKFFKDNPGIHAFEVTGPLYWGWLSADGYMDRTDIVLGESKAEVASQLLELYFDHEEMDEDEEKYKLWLEEVKNKGE